MTNREKADHHMLRKQDGSESATKWLLLTNSIQGYDQVLQGVSKVQIRIEHLKER